MMPQNPGLDLLADPLRLAVLRRLSEGPPASLPELAGVAGVHVNTARPHVLALARAGVLIREAEEPVGRGRPADRYRLAEDWRMPAADLGALAELLAALVLRLGPDPAQVERFGRDWGRFLVGRPGSPELDRELPRALERLGFNARIDGDNVVLSSCPCPLVAPERPELLCGLIVAVIEGAAEAIDPGLRVTRNHHDPQRRVCSAVLARSGRRPLRPHRQKTGVSPRRDG